MKTKLLDISGKEKSTIDLPKEFSAEIREDIVAKVLEAKKIQQPYAPSPVAGKQHCAKGKIVHRRHVWRSGYGRGQSRVPRKIFSRRGTQFNWAAAEVPSARGGIRAHPPKISQFQARAKINKKEMKIAFESALSATANSEFISKKYSTLEEKKITNAPFIVSSEITKLKIKELLETIKKILNNDLFEVAIRKKSLRAGIGKRRGRKYKSTAGMLLVIGNDEELKTNAFEIANVNSLSVVNLAEGGLGRITIYTEKAIKDLENKFKGDKK